MGQFRQRFSTGHYPTRGPGQERCLNSRRSSRVGSGRVRESHGSGRVGKF